MSSFSNRPINTYRHPSNLVLNDHILKSVESTTQGDPLAMIMYALATVPLIKCLQNSADGLVS